MKAPRNLLKALNVRRDEWWLVQKLFLLQFFQGAGIAFFFTAAFSRFLKLFPVTDLAYVFILSSLLLWVVGFVYDKLEHKLPLGKLCKLITIVLAGSALLFRAGAAVTEASWFYFLTLAWFYVLYLLNNLMFWGIASQLYDVRQSKRLFSVISAGDIPAKFIGYSVALIIVTYIGTANLLLAAFIFISLSFPFLKNVLHAGKTADHHDHSAKTGTAVHTIVKDFTVNKLVKRIALLSLIVSACIILINFGFYAEIKQAYKNDVEFARFIAFFLAIARLIALVIKILFTSRLLYWLGNRMALIITPIILIILFASLLLTDVMTYNSKMVLYIFGLSAIVIDVLSSAINSPVLLTLMQPLSTLERLRAHHIVKGIMDPFAYLFSGIFIIVAIQFKLFTLQLLSYVLLALAVAWIIGIFKVHQQYLKTLIKTISSRYFSQEEFNLYDTAARELIEEKINTGSELEVLYILKMLGSQRNAESNRLIIHALHQPSATIVTEALRLISQLHIKAAESWLQPIIEKHPVANIRSQAIKVLAEIAFQDSVIVPLMESPEHTIRNSSIISILNHSQLSANTIQAENKLRALLNSTDVAEKKEAVDILCETGNGQYEKELIKLLDEKDKTLQVAAIRAMGYHPTTAGLAALIKKIDTHEKDVIEALIIAREKSLSIIKTCLVSLNSPLKQKENLINALGRIGGKAAHSILLGLTKELPGFEPYIIKVLHRCHYKTDKTAQPFIEDHIRKQLINAAALLHMQKKILPNLETYKILYGSIELQLYEIRETLLFLFSFIYDRDKISKIKAAIEIKKKETNANAIELVDMTVKKEFANPFNAAFEWGDLEHRCDLLKNLFPKDIFPDMESILANILADKKIFYNNWTITCSMFFSKKMDHHLEKHLFDKYLDSNNHLLKETAGYATQIN